MTTKQRLICPQCGNNMCLIYPDIFAQHHLKGADKRWYDAKKKALDDFLLEKMAEYKESLLEK